MSKFQRQKFFAKFFFETFFFVREVRKIGWKLRMKGGYKRLIQNRIRPLKGYYSTFFIRTFSGKIVSTKKKLRKNCFQKLQKKRKKLQKNAKKNCKNIPKNIVKIFRKYSNNTVKILQKYCKTMPKIWKKFVKKSKNPFRCWTIFFTFSNF